MLSLSLLKNHVGVCFMWAIPPSFGTGTKEITISFAGDSTYLAATHQGTLTFLP